MKGFVLGLLVMGAVLALIVYPYTRYLDAQVQKRVSAWESSLR